VDWKQQIDPGDRWVWRGDKLWHKSATEVVYPARKSSTLQNRFVKLVYADQNRSKAVEGALRSLLGTLGSDGIGLNIGAGGTRYQGVVNLEIADGPEIDIIGFGSELPFRDGTVDLVIAQEVLEHVPDFLELVAEIRRVLKPGGIFFCQVPFQIGFHPGPYDYWRFSRQGLEHLFRAPEWEIQQLSISLGHGSGFYRIAVEFFAVTASCLFSKLYRPMKVLAALFLYPLKLFDLVTERSQERDRIPGGYFCIAMKSQTP